jgi:hypothetical protein
MLKTIQRLHLIMGLVSIIVVIFLTLTGIFLNHSEELSLYESYPTNSIVLWLYANKGLNEEGMEEDFIEEPPTWERVLTAFHAGRFFGRPGNLFLDMAGVILILLAVTGPYIWIRRLVLLKTNRKLREEEALIEKTEKLLKVRSSARSFLKRAGQLHDISEHVLQHMKEPEGPVARDIEEIERHLVDLDSRMHELIRKIEGLEKEVTST